MLLKGVTGAVAGLAIGLFFKGVEFVLKRPCGYVVSEGYNSCTFFGESCSWLCMGCLLCMLILVSVKCYAQEIPSA